ncbi:hypothetical protein [Patiriisocius sp. Uisw_017]|uniref:hypothetical protein n=1 Tax=Patiriisocius sp. Uisw_017 TaxID=3230968 RepID=UPI0039E82519
MTLENNLDLNSSHDLKLASKNNKTIISRLVIVLLWLLFAGNFAYLTLNFNNIPEWYLGSVFKINGFTILIWTTVTFFSAIVSSYAGKYLKGFRYHSRFMILCFGFTLSVILLVMSNYILLLLFSWLIMGIFMSRLIGIDKTWGKLGKLQRLRKNTFSREPPF